MSIDSPPSSQQELSPFKRRFETNLHPSKPLQSTLSQSEQFTSSRQSLKSPTKEQRHQKPEPSARTRTMSVSDEACADAATEPVSIPILLTKHDNKRDKRGNELKPIVDRHDHTPVERRYSTPQLHFSSLFPHPFRNNKNHQQNNKTNAKDETNTANLIPSNPNASAATSFQFSDMMTMKADPSFSLKSSTISTSGSRNIPSNSNDRSLTSQNEESTSGSCLFILDESNPEPRSADLFIFESHTPLCISEIYHDHFFDHFHINYSGEFDTEGPFIASLRYIYPRGASTDNCSCEARALIRTQNRNYDVSEMVNATNENNILQVLFSKAHLSSVRTYGPIGDPKANEKIYLFDKINHERYNCKIGVIYQRSKQTNEYDMFCNDSLTNEMRDFLDSISNPVDLKGYNKYRGDLDTKNDLHGDYSYYTEYENHEIMFNIAPIIPSTKANGQCIERKGLVGNAFVCIVFQEPGANFIPDFISGKVTQVYITVKPCTIDNELYYKITTWRRNDISSIIDPPGGIYKYDKSFRCYFLTLLLNSVNVAIESPSLRSRVFEQRQRLKCEELRKLSHIFSVGPIPDFAGDFDNINYPLDTRSNTRSDSFASNATATTSDSTNTGRISPVSSKKKGFSKFFGVFSGRSGSISSASTPPNQASNDVSSSNSQTPSISEGTMTLGRVVPSSTKELVKRSRSIKSNQAPVRSPPTSQPNQTINIQPPTPTVVSPYIYPQNPLVFGPTDGQAQNSLLNSAAWDIAPRSRSNSSPEDTINSNKPHSLSASIIDEEDDFSNSSHGDNFEEESNDDEGPSNRPTLTNRPQIYPSNNNL